MTVTTLDSFTKLEKHTAVDNFSMAEEAITRFESAEKIVLRWDASNSGFLPFEEDAEGTSGAMDYFASVDDILSLSVDASDDIRNRANTLVHIAMTRLADEMLHLMDQNTVPLQPDRLYGSIERFSSHMLESSDCGTEESETATSSFLFSSSSSMSVDSLRSIRLSLSLDVLSIDLIRQEAVDDLKKIMDRMIRAGYGNECCQIYIGVRKEFLSVCLSLFGLDKMSIEDVQKEDWNTLDYVVKKWCRIVKIVVKVILSAEKQLCDFFFDQVLMKVDCFAEIAKVYIRQLLNFGEAVAISHRSSEKLFSILDMHDALANVMPDLHSFFLEKDRVKEKKDLNPICHEAEEIVAELGGAAKCAFMEFENQVKSNLSPRKFIPGGGIHPKCRYVLNYMLLTLEYSDALDVILADNERIGDGEGVLSHLGIRLKVLISHIESNLQEKSNLYEDIGLKYIFLMNNTLYIIKKLKESYLGSLMGEEWIRRRNGLIRQYSTAYLRVSWTRILTCLKPNGFIGNNSSSRSGIGSSKSASRTAVKEMFKNFNLVYDEIYRTQCAWKVPDPQLREELMISISEMVIPAYRLFMSRFASHLEGERHASKFIKYTPEDLETHLTVFFSGSSTSSNHLWRRHSSTAS